MISSQGVGTATPRRTQTRHDRSGISAIFVHFEHGSGELGRLPQRATGIRQRQAASPFLPCIQEIFSQNAKTLGKRCVRERGSTKPSLRKCQCQNASGTGRGTRQSYRAVVGRFEIVC